MKSLTIVFFLILTITGYSQDTTPPVAICMDATVQLDATGNAFITANDIDDNSTDDVAIQSLSVSPSNFDCSQLGANTVTLTVTDTSGNSATCTATVTVEDMILPVAACNDFQLTLLPNGMGTLTNADLLTIAGGSSDNCNLTFSASRTAFDCNDVLNVLPSNLVVTGVIDGPLPGGLPKAIELYTIAEITAADLSQYGIGTANDGGGSDGQEFTFPTPAANIAANTFIYIASEAVEFNNFFGRAPDYTSTDVNIDGNDAVELYFQGNVVDVFGEINTDGAGEPWEYTNGWAYRIGSTGPDGTLFNSGNWFFSSPGGLNNETTNAGASLPFPEQTFVFPTPSGSPTPIPVTITVTDDAGNTDTCITNITVLDATPPTPVCQDISVQLDIDGNAFLNADDLDNGSTDACGILSFSANPSSFSCSDVGAPVPVTLTITDFNSNTSTCQAMVTVEDNVDPTVITKNTTLSLSTAGTITIDPTDIDDGSFDLCGITTRTVTPSTLSCANVGANTVTLTIVDINGNSSSNTAIVTIEDITPPDVICQNVTIQLNAAGVATLSPSQVDNGSTDNCSISALALDTTTFNCSQLGSNNVQLTVTDSSGNSASCMAVITVEENIPPVANAMDIQVAINTSGSVTITGNDVDNGSSDNCSISNITVSPNTFTCADVGAAVPVVMTVTDGSGNSSNANANITVIDNVPPNAICRDITVNLDSNGMATISVADVDNGSSVACGAATTSIDVNSFDCSNLGPNNVVLSVTNSNNVTSTCTAIVTVEDNNPPSVVCQDITVFLDSSGMASITVNDIDNGSTDNCGIASRSIDITDFDCNDVGANNVELTILDINGNSSSCIAVVTVEDTEDPTAVCRNITISLDANGAATITALDVDNGSSDFCGIASRSIDINTFDCSNLGANTVQLTVTDFSGNSDTCAAIVTVEDASPPVAVCQDITVALDNSGNAFITASQLDGGSSDACGISSIDISNSVFNCTNIGSNSVTLSVTDTSGNTSSCTAIVTIQDTTPPTVICQDITVQLDGSGNPFINASDIDGGTFDACGLGVVSISNNAFTCANIGSNSVTLTASDINGNSSSCTATVTVVDTIDPTVTCPPNQEVQATGGVFEVPDYFQTGLAFAIDNCTNPLTIVTQNPAAGTELVVGSYTVSVTVEDNQGNSSSCNFSLIVDDILGTDATLLNTEIELYPNPIKNQLTISHGNIQREAEFYFYDLTGRLLMNRTLDPSVIETLIDTSHLPSATYIIQIVSKEGTLIKQLLKE